MHTRILTKHNSTYGVNLPAEIVEHLRLRQGDKLTIWLEPATDVIRITPVRPRPRIGGPTVLTGWNKGG